MKQEPAKHTLITDHLVREIRKGHLRVGELIPTESELMRAFGVSRNTVRTALQNLKFRGFIESRQGQGSRVLKLDVPGAFVETIQSIDELVIFGKETKRELLSQKIQSADAELARKFECAEGRLIAEAVMLRSPVGNSDQPIAVVTLWMDALIEPVIEKLSTINKSASEIIATEFGYEPKVVTQEVSADTASEADAEALGLPDGAPALIIERRYKTEADAVPYLIARSVCRADTIKVASRFVNSS